MAGNLKIMENDKHPLDNLKNDKITEKRTTETQERTSLPGLLVEANRITKGTSYN